MISWAPPTPEQSAEIDRRILNVERPIDSSFPGVVLGQGRMFMGGRTDIDTVGFLYGEHIPQRLAQRGTPVDEGLLLVFGRHLVLVYKFEWVAGVDESRRLQFGVRPPHKDQVLELNVDYLRRLPHGCPPEEEPDLSDFMTEVEIACGEGLDVVTEMLKNTRPQWRA